ncbi:MAG: tetratricopeptide repeat protein [Planctomycetota bacterium]|nr:tetratricopeptide repeat protein [Planctomycetota bacterium]
MIYQKILEAEPDNAVALNNLAWLASFDTKRAAEALGLAKRSIEQAGPLPDLLDTHGLIYLNLSQAPEAIAILKAAVDDFPTPTLWFHLALAYELANEHEDALKSRDQARATGFRTGSIMQIERVAFKTLLERLELDDK